MKFGANTFIWTEAFGPEHFPILPRLKEAGFDGIEVAMLAPADVPAAAIRRELAKYGFKCTCCSAFGPGLNLASEDAAVRAKAMTHGPRFAQGRGGYGGVAGSRPVVHPSRLFHRDAADTRRMEPGGGLLA
jgi:hypothetical protein